MFTRENMRTVEKFASLQMLRLTMISGETMMGGHTRLEITLIISKFRMKLENFLLLLTFNNKTQFVLYNIYVNYLTFKSEIRNLLYFHSFSQFSLSFYLSTLLYLSRKIKSDPTMWSGNDVTGS